MSTLDSLRSERGVTMQDIADRCGVSKVTVSRALRNDLRYVSKSVAERIVATASEMRYNPSRHQAARRLALMKVGQQVINQVIALYFPAEFFQVNYFGAVFRGVMDASIDHKYSLLSIASYDVANPTMAPVFSRGDVDGIISMANPEEFSKVLKMLRAEINFGRRPAVSAIHPVDDCAAVVTDDYSGGYASASHLLDLGHRHMPHFVVREQVYPHYERLRGYRRAYIDRGLDPNQYLRGCLWHEETDLSPGYPAPMNS